MKVKDCFKCHVTKPLSYFYKHKRMGDGHLNKCKECTKADTLKNRGENLEYYREYDRSRANLPKRKKLRKKIAEKWKSDPKLRKRTCEHKKLWSERNVLKRASHIIAGNYIRDGFLEKQPCEMCGKKKVDAHHEDYSKPLDVTWLCKKHHFARHRELNEIKRKK